MALHPLALLLPLVLPAIAVTFIVALFYLHESGPLRRWFWLAALGLVAGGMVAPDLCRDVAGGAPGPWLTPWTVVCAALVGVAPAYASMRAVAGRGPRVDPAREREQMPAQLAARAPLAAAVYLAGAVPALYVARYALAPLLCR